LGFGPLVLYPIKKKSYRPNSCPLSRKSNSIGTRFFFVAKPSEPVIYGNQYILLYAKRAKGGNIQTKQQINGIKCTISRKMKNGEPRKKAPMHHSNCTLLTTVTRLLFLHFITQ